jgi:hypothetical protein
MSRVWRSSMFLEYFKYRCVVVRWCLGPGERSLVSFYIIIATIIWIELVKYWRKACLLASLDYIVDYDGNVFYFIFYYRVRGRCLREEKA